MEFEKVLARAKEKSGGTQKSLAKKAGVSQGAVSKWERGTSMPDVGGCLGLSAVLDGEISLEQIIRSASTQR